MGYVSVQGGTQAIENAEALSQYLRLRGGSEPVSVRQIQEQLGLLVDRVIGEGGIYAPMLAALALKQAEGDPTEASFFLRAYRSTLRRVGDSVPIDTASMRLSRRISSAFRDIPGGQILGPTPDYRQRILNFDLINEDGDAARAYWKEYRRLAGETTEPLDPLRFKKVVDLLRADGLIADGPVADEPGAERVSPESDTRPAVDVTTDSVSYPLHRSGRLQMMARAETGGLLAIAYSSMRGYGSVHPTIAELRVGKTRLEIVHPYREGETLTLGSIEVTEVEIVATAKKSEKDGKRRFTLGYGGCFGRNELKAISMAVLDRAMQAEKPKAPAEDQEFVLYHTDGIESSGFCSHFKLPHYVTFQSALDRLRASQRQSADLNALKRASTQTAGNGRR